MFFLVFFEDINTIYGYMSKNVDFKGFFQF